MKLERRAYLMGRKTRLLIMKLIKFLRKLKHFEMV